MSTHDPINLAKYYFPYGFHRSNGAYPGNKLFKKLQPIVTQSVREQKSVVINLDDMKALYGSFIDGAFGEFIDEYKDNFFNVFVFVSEKNPTHLNAIRRVYQLHVDKNFNRDLGSNV
jgi:hypothetical protein